MSKKNGIEYYLEVETFEGSCSFMFDDEANLMNFIHETRPHVFGMRLSYLEFSDWMKG